MADGLKVRIGVSLAGTGGADFAGYVDDLEARGIDSLWLSELVYSPLVDPFIGMAYALSRTTSLKVGTGVAVLPGRSPILVAKQLASLARLAPKRVLPVFGLSPARPAERAAFPVPEGKRGAVFDESLEVVRRLLREPSVTFHGDFFDFDDASIGEPPQPPLDIWLGGSAPAGLRRIGRYADGWLASFITPDEAAAGVQAIKAAAAESGREVDPDHYGISLSVAFGDLPDQLVKLIYARRKDVPLGEIVPQGWDAARALMERYIEAGLSKFVLRAATPLPEGEAFLSRFTKEILPLQT
ncbi:MAG TPA: TIGR03854 family LLM class F420-dependent oxidoreductase [Frankiaceae bacterium]|nr:TIGR03854 family LLM class F420-dependent oxidoreductase [Frankiaceae bacterium]